MSRATLKSTSMRVESSGSTRTACTDPAFIPPNRTAAPGSSPPANLKYARWGIVPRLKTPATESAVPTSRAAATSTNKPTHTCSRLEFILFSHPGNAPERPAAGRSLRRKSPSFLGRAPPLAPALPVFCQHLQVIQFILDLRLRHAVQKLTHARVGAACKFLLRADRDDVAAVDQEHAVRDQECTGQFVRDHHHRDGVGLLQIQNQVVDARRNDRIKP